MLTDILLPNIPKVNAEVHICHDCQQPMELIHQPLFRGGSLSMITCKNNTCSLATVTLSIEQYAQLTDDQFQAYRLMVAQRAVWAVSE